MEVKIDFIGKKSRERKNIAIIHGRVKINARRKNLEVIRRFIRVARLYGSRVVILPPFFNTGPIMEFNDLSKKRYVKRRFEHITDQSIQVVRGLAISESISIIVPAFLEKAGAHYYVSSLYIGMDGRLRCRYKKIVLSDIESLYNIVSGKEANVFYTRIFNFGVLINEEILYPEIFKLYRIQGCNFFLVALNPFTYQYPYTSFIARSRALENSSPIALLGSIVEYHSVEGGAPTVIYNCNGDLVYEYNGLEPKIIIINPDSIQANDLEPSEYARIMNLNKLLLKTFRRINKKSKQDTSKPYDRYWSIGFGGIKDWRERNLRRFSQ